MTNSASTSPARALTDITQTLQHQHNRSQPSPPPPPSPTPHKPCQPSPLPPCNKLQRTHSSSSPPSAFRHPQHSMSSPSSARLRTTDSQSSPSAAQSSDAFDQWMDAVIPLVHNAPADKQPEPTEQIEEVADESTETDSDIQPYVAINPSLLHDSRWSYRDLQLLCQRLGLGGRGDRTLLIHKLRTWNRTHFSSATTQPNTAASNFALLCITSTATTTGSGSERYGGQLTPLKVRTPRLCDGSPRSALSGGRGASVRSDGRRLSFSVFNGVKIIPPRTLQYEDEEEAADEDVDMVDGKETRASAGAEQQSVATKEAASVVLCQDAEIAAKCVQLQLVDHAVDVQMQQQRLSKDGHERVEQQAVDDGASVSLRRSARKRMPSRKARESQL